MAFNLRAVFSADTKDIKKGSKEAQEQVKAFEKTTEGAIDHVAGLFGTSMSQISQTLNSVKGGFMALNKGINGSAAATNLTTKAMNGLKIAIASTGIGALIVALGSLIAYFTKTQRGADGLAKQMGTLGQVLKTTTDYAIKLGEKILWAVKKPISAVDALGASLKKNIMDRVEGLKVMFESLGQIMSNVFAGRFKEALSSANEFARGFGQVMSGMTLEEMNKLNQQAGTVLDDFNEKIARRNALTLKSQEYEKKRIAFITEEAELEARIAQLREKVEDRLSYSASQRLAYEKEAIALTTELFSRRKELAQEQLEIIAEENALSESMNKDIETEQNARREVINLTTQQSSQMREMLTKQAELTNQVAKEREERAKMAALTTTNRVKLDLPQVSDEAIKDKIPNQVFTITPVIDQKKLLEDMQKMRDELRPIAEEFTFDIESTVEGLINGIAQSMGEMLAGLLTGEAKLSDLIGAIVSMLGQALQQIGAALVAYGVSMEAFKKAFSNPYAAIAAGIALQAAGAALTSIIQRTMGGASSTTTVGANAGLISGGSSVTIGQTASLSGKQQEINVNVTGTLKGKGKDLVAVIESEDKRKGLSS